MRRLKSPTVWCQCLWLAVCNPETDLGKEQAATAGAEGSAGPLSGAVASPESGQLLDPPAGLSAVAPNLAAVIVRFPEAVMPAGQGPAALLEPSDGADPVALALTAELPCSAKCYLFAPGASLRVSTVHTVRVAAGGLQRLDGKPVPEGDLGSFTTASDPDLFAPRVEAFTLQIAEGCATVHVEADEPVRAEIEVSANGVDASLASPLVGLALDFVQRLPDLSADPHGRALASIVDRAGNRASSEPVVLDLPAAVEPVVITEVLANPAGSETTQEFVELYNAGVAAVTLGGWTVEDKKGSDVLPESVLPAGAYALVVSDAYDPTDGKDPAPAEGTLLLHVSGRIGSDGLTNSGEPVRLVNAQGQVVSQYGGWIDASATAWSGKSTKRVALDACDAADAWSKTPSSPTPGW